MAVVKMCGDRRGSAGMRGDGRVRHSAPNCSNIIMATHTDTFGRAVRQSMARCANRQSTAVTQHSAPASSSPSWKFKLLPCGAQYGRVRPGAPTGTLRAAVRSADHTDRWAVNVWCGDGFQCVCDMRPHITVRPAGAQPLTTRVFTTQ